MLQPQDTYLHSQCRNPNGPCHLHPRCHRSGWVELNHVERIAPPGLMGPSACAPPCDRGGVPHPQRARLAGGTRRAVKKTNFKLPIGRFVLEDRVSDVSDALAVYVQAPPAPLEAGNLYGLPRIEDLHDPCVGSASFSDIHPGRCPLRLGARASGPGCCSRWRSSGCGGQLRRCATRRRLGFSIDPPRHPQNGNRQQQNGKRQQQYRHEHWDRPGDVTCSGGLLAEKARTSWTHRRHTRHFLATLRTVYEWHWNTRWLIHSRINE